MTLDPLGTNPDHYRLVFENDRVRVLAYEDDPGQVTTPHAHPDSVMITLSAFRRRLHAGDQTRDVDMVAGKAQWLPAQEHHGENTGDTPTHTLFVELKEPPPRETTPGTNPSDGADPDRTTALGPTGP